MGKLKMQSPDLTKQNIDRLAEVFPNCVTEPQADDGAVCRDAGFISDAVKINVEQIFKLLSPDTEVRTI